MYCGEPASAAAALHRLPFILSAPELRTIRGVLSRRCFGGGGVAMFGRFPALLC